MDIDINKITLYRNNDTNNPLINPVDSDNQKIIKSGKDEIIVMVNNYDFDFYCAAYHNDKNIRWVKIEPIKQQHLLDNRFFEKI